MGDYVNPSYDNFLEALNSSMYVDKTGLISFFNSVLSTKDKEVVFTRPRRFGKTIACDMLAAYYSEGCDSEKLFKGLEIEKDPSFKAHLNRHPVIYFSMMTFMNYVLKKDADPVVEIVKTISEELQAEYPDIRLKADDELPRTLCRIAEETGRKFIFIIDEWDMVLRERKDDRILIDEYITLLRSLFRSSETGKYLAGAYMTGILPIIKYNTQSALSDFREYTMLNPKRLARYAGFTADEVHAVCQKFHADEVRMKEWYDGYRLKGAGDVYCPNSVMMAAMNDDYSSHWTATSAMEALMDYIHLNLDGLRDAVNDLIDGKMVKVRTGTFENRLDRVDTKDKVLTILVHLGYLAYDPDNSTVRIPNFEVRLHMLNVISESPDPVFMQRIQRCEKAIEATSAMDEETIAEILEEIHNERPPRYYNDEQALRYTVLMAYNNSPLGEYIAFEELSSGKGYVDILFKPKQGSSDLPVLIELKSGASVRKAITQIHEKDYVDFLKKIEYHGDVMLVGVNYSPDTRKHTCRIEKIMI